MTFFAKLPATVTILFCRSLCIVFASAPKTTENRETAHWYSPPPLFWLSGNVNGHPLAVVPQFGTKDRFYSAIYFIALISNNAAHKVAKI